MQCLNLAYVLTFLNYTAGITRIEYAAQRAVLLRRGNGAGIQAAAYGAVDKCCDTARVTVCGGYVGIVAAVLYGAVNDSGYGGGITVSYELVAAVHYQVLDYAVGRNDDKQTHIHHLVGA